MDIGFQRVVIVTPHISFYQMIRAYLYLINLNYTGKSLYHHLTKEQYKQILEYCAKNGVNYFTFNVKNTVCDDCGYISKHTLTKCPKCGSTHILYASRPIGYLTLIKTWSKDRQIEESQRIYSNELGNIG